MKYDHDKQHPTLYVLGLFFLVLSMCLFAFSAYIFPFLIFNWVYEVPGFLLHAREWLHRNYGHEYELASMFIFLFFFLLAIITGSIARKASVKLDREFYEAKLAEATTETEREQIKSASKKEAKESARVVMKIIMFMIIVIILLTLFELFLYIEP